VAQIDRRDFLKKSGTGLAAVATSSLWFDLLVACKIPSAASGFFAERFGVTEEDMKAGDDLEFKGAVNGPTMLAEGFTIGGI
jgi:hypothetical protein